MHRTRVQDASLKNSLRHSISRGFQLIWRRDVQNQNSEAVLQTGYILWDFVYLTGTVIR